MAEILVKTLTRHRKESDPEFMKDWTAGDAVVGPDGAFTSNKYAGSKKMGVVLKVPGVIPEDGFPWEPDNDEWNEEAGIWVPKYRTKYVVDLEKWFALSQIRDFFDHDCFVHPITLNKGLDDLLIHRFERSILHPFDQQGSFSSGIVDVGPNGDPDASTFREFESNIAANLTGDLTGDCDEAFEETLTISVGGQNTGSYVLTFKTSGAGRHSGAATSNAWRKTATDTGQSIYLFSSFIGNLELDGLQVFTTKTSASTGHTYAILSAINQTSSIGIKNCIFRADVDSASTGRHYGFYPYNAAQTVRVNNNLFYGYKRDSNCAGMRIYMASGYVYNNTFIDNSIGLQSPGNVSLKNNLSVGNSWTAYAKDSSTTGTNNAADDRSDFLDNFVNLSAYSLTDIFNDPANEDFRLKSTSPVIGQGADLDGDPYIAVTDDIVGTARDSSTPDIGCFEYASAAQSILITDSGAGTDGFAGFNASNQVSDQTAAIDSLGVSAALAVPDSGAVTELLTGGMVDLVVSDLADGIETVNQLLARLSLNEQAHGQEVVVRFIMDASGRYIARFEALPTNWKAAAGASGWGATAGPVNWNAKTGAAVWGNTAEAIIFKIQADSKGFKN